MGQLLAQWKLAPAAHVRGLEYALPGKVDGPAETGATAVQFHLALPASRDLDDPGEHPLAAALAISSPGLAPDPAVPLEDRHRELRAADIDGQRVQENSVRSSSSRQRKLGMM